MKFGFKCFYTNIDTLNNKKAEFEARTVLMNPDIIGLSEINPKNAKWKLTQQDLQIKGYTMYENISGRGVVLYVREDIKSNLISVNDSGAVSVWCEIALRDGDRLLIGVVYRSPSTDREDNCLMMEMMSQMMSRKPSHILIMGDYNYPSIDWIAQTAETEQEQLFLDKFRDWFLWQHVDRPTRYRHGQSANILDLVMTNEENMLDLVSICEPIGKSDHATLQ